MSTPDSPAQQRYSAGSCRLEVTILQLSALSKWYAQPLTEDVSFQLWLQSSEMTLVAQGDRAALQAIADYIQQKIQNTLAIAQLSRSSALGAIATEPLIQPSTLQLSQPLSYLQLCDLSTVLSQYQQATKTLPVSLNPAVASTQSSQTPQNSQSQIIPFPLNRRANPRIHLSRSKIWASSAAAAVFAIGLTATLWPNISSQVAQTEADSTLIEPIKPNAASEPKASAPPTGQTIAPKPESGSDNRSETSLNNRSGTAAKVDAVPTAPNSNTASEALPRNRATNRNASSPSLVAEDSAPAPARSAKAPAADNPLSDNSPPVNPSIVRPPAVATEPESARSSAPSSDSLADAANAESSNAESSGNTAAPSTARLSARSSTTEVIAQVQSYFDTQWQAIRAADRQALQAPLVYRLQLSETGEVVSFTALNEPAQVWRDRLFFASNPPTFNAMTATSDPQSSPNLVLRLTVTTDGQIQVSEF